MGHDFARMTGDFVKFRLCGAGAKDAGTNTVLTDFFGESFAEGEVEGLGGRVGGDVRDSLEGGSRAENEDVAAAAFDHTGKIKVGEVNDCGAIHLDHFELGPQIGLVKRTVGAETGVVDQQVDGDVVDAGEIEDCGGRAGLAEICSENFDANRVFGAQIDG